MSQQLTQTADLIKQINIKNEKSKNFDQHASGLIGGKGGTTRESGEIMATQVDSTGGQGAKKKGKVKRFFRALCCMRDDD